MATLNSVDLSKVETISWTKTANLIPIPLPGGDSSSTETFDMLGVIKIITVTGTVTGANPAAVKTIIDNIAAEVDGNQMGSVVFNSTETGNLNVKVDSFDVSWNVPGFVATYSLRLVEGI